MKRLKKWMACFLTTALLLGLMTHAPIAQAADDYLLKVGTNTMYSTTTLAQIKTMFGQPKLETDSLFGGVACTFYSDNYDDYLYIETTADGKIAAYGSVGPNFRTPKVVSGEEYDDGGWLTDSLYATDYDGLLYGMVDYCYENIENRPDESLYQSDVKWNLALCHHATLMWNAMSKLYGDDTPAVFDERAVLVNQQLMENGSNLYEYCADSGQTNNFSLVFMNSTKYGMANPLLMSRAAARYHVAPGNIGVYVVIKDGGLLCGSLNPGFFATGTLVEYTEEEQRRLQAVRQVYAQSVSDWNSGAEVSYFNVEPQYKTLPLNEGTVNVNCLKGAVGFLNAIRVGAGLPTLTLSEQLSEGAQCKATLTRYLGYKEISNPSPHFPPRPDGISDEFYRKAQSGSGENLYYGNALTSIIHALHDGEGDPIQCGHRWNLLNPTYLEIGLGSCAGQGVHKMSGYQASDVDFVGWPSEGIMLEEAGASTAMFTGWFNNGYTVTDHTAVKFRCLNTGEEWNFTPDMTNTSTEEYYITKENNQVSYYNKSINLKVGNVYQVTFEHLKDTDGKEKSYTYRSVYESAYAGESVAVQSVTLNTGRVQGAVGKTAKLRATINPNQATLKMISWSTSDASVVTVNENGILTFVGEGTATVTAQADNGVKATATVNVTSLTRKIGDVNNDSTVNSGDALAILKHSVKQLAFSDEDWLAAEVSGDRKVTSADALLILKYVVKQMSRFPCEG